MKTCKQLCAGNFGTSQIINSNFGNEKTTQFENFENRIPGQLELGEGECGKDGEDHGGEGGGGGESGKDGEDHR